jgi:hypothetical protein
MAGLQVAVAEEDSVIGEALPNAYVRVIQYTHNLQTDSISFFVEWFATKPAFNRGRRAIKAMNFNVLDTALTGTGKTENKLLTYMKTLPEFAGAIDA